MLKSIESQNVFQSGRYYLFGIENGAFFNLALVTGGSMGSWGKGNLVCSPPNGPFPSILYTENAKGGVNELGSK